MEQDIVIENKWHPYQKELLKTADFQNRIKKVKSFILNIESNMIQDPYQINSGFINLDKIISMKISEKLSAIQKELNEIKHLSNEYQSRLLYEK